MRFFCLLFFVLGGNPISKKSESPEGAKPGISEYTEAASRTPNNTQTCQSSIKTTYPEIPQRTLLQASSFAMLAAMGQPFHGEIRDATASLRR
ncbi:hypothetical protein ACSVIJ_01495 [Pseudomonas sp. NCHU5208]|uniref:hypothetical protein n=1 Tax=unclassified Pseudomonas TaxID=196821 RepID=UPI003F949393